VAEWSDEETDDPLIADHRNFYKVEKWTRDGMKVDSLLYAGNNLSKAQEIFANAIQAPAADQDNDQAANAHSATVAAAEMAGLTRAQFRRTET
jgi:hypothetical protein